MPYGHASMLLHGEVSEGSEATEPYNKYDKLRPHSIRSPQFDQKVRPLSFRPEKFNLFTATATLLYCAPVWLNQNAAKLQSFQAFVDRCILQTRFNPNESAADVILGTPLFDTVCRNISAKFLAKVLQQRDLSSELFIKKMKEP